jgi:hypothetical protein
MSVAHSETTSTSNAITSHSKDINSQAECRTSI